MNLDQYKPLLRSKGTLLGRILLGLLFAFSGFGMLMGGVGNTAMYFESMGLPMAGLLAIIVILVKIGGGLALIAGYKAEEAAFALLIFTGLTILVAHRSYEDINLWKNLSIMGGMLYVMAYGAGEGWKVKI